MFNDGFCGGGHLEPHFQMRFLSKIWRDFSVTAFGVCMVSFIVKELLNRCGFGNFI
jgi:hypothetical protein